MTNLLTAAQMRALENGAIAQGSISGLELMERAGQGVVDAIFEHWPDLAQTQHSAVILCGPGNNGGDGFVIARLLKTWGWQVAVYLYGAPEALTPDAKANHSRWDRLGTTHPLTDVEDLDLAECVSKSDVVIDALFGTGLSRAVTAPHELYWIYYQRWGTPRRKDDATNSSRMVAIDIATGLCSDSGQVLRPANDENAELHAHVDLTVSFHTAKVGHYLAEGPLNSGTLRVVDIGLPAKAPDDSVRLIEAPSVALNKASVQHKYHHGHALILSGGPGRGGAARLAARGALRIGAGLVTIACPPGALQENAARLEAIMLKSLPSAEDLTRLLTDDPRFNALCIGPGFGTGPKQRDIIAAVLDAKRATVLDADALTLIASDPALFGKVHADCILTPHAGEFARLFPDIAEQLSAPATKGPAYSKVDATRAAAQRAGCTVLYKGPDTVIAALNGQCAINASAFDRAAPWLATAGSGDVLAGFVTGLLARDATPMKAAETAAWIHTECAIAFGPGLIAEDIPETLPKLLQQLES